MKLGDYATLVNESVKPDQVAEDFPYIGLEHIEADALRLNGIGKAGEVSSNKLKFLAGDTLFGKLRPYFRKVIQPTFDGICSTDIWVLRGLQGSDPRFLRYWVSSQGFVNHVNQASEGTRMPRAKWDIAKDHYLPEISHSDQKAIAHILGTLDDKIELNRKMNETLEEIAKAIFKSWFVDFDPVRAKMGGRPTGLPDDIAALFPDRLVDSEIGEIPEGWSEKPIAALCDKIESGGTPARKTPEFWQGGNIDWYKTGEFDDAPLFESEEHITDTGLSKSAAKLWERGTILFAMYGATVGKMASLTSFGTANQAVAGLIPSSEYGFAFLWQALVHGRRELINLANGAAQQNLNLGLIKDFKVITPSGGLPEKYSSSFDCVFDRIELLHKESRILAVLRDTLLPKLISGELQVPDAEKFLEEAGI